MASPMISIIIPVFNSSQTIKETLQSVKDQTYSKWECLLIDDGSTDGSMELIRGFVGDDKRFRLLSRPGSRSKGPSACRNVGLERSRGSLVMFLDSDDLLHGQTLESRLDTTSQFPDHDLWIFPTKTFLEDRYDDNRIFNMQLDDYSNKNYLRLFEAGKHPFCVMSPLWKREALIETGGFNEALMVFEDPDLHIRALRAGLRTYTAIGSKPDTFYRLNLAKRKGNLSAEVIRNRDRSALLFYGAYLTDDNRDLKVSAFNYFRDQVIPASNTLLRVKLFILFLRKGVFPKKRHLLIPILIIYQWFGIETVNGLGYYRIHKFVYSS